ncbi:MAG: CoB--CoM heterodisulfide reductase iron-sulfur subunit B family protein [Archaeoglobaceae archaeon]
MSEMSESNSQLRYAYFPGCSSKSTSIEYHISTLKVAEKLGIELVDMEQENCCGTHNVEDYNEDVWLALNARNLALAEGLGADLVTICSGCFLTTKKAQKALEIGQKEKEKVNKILHEINREYSGSSKVKHILGVLVEDFGLDKLSKFVEKELGIKVAPYYGCQLLRPPEITRFDDPENPKSFERLLETIGCEVADYTRKIDCCGAPLTLTEGGIVKSMVEKIIQEVRESDADCISTICPLCHYALETTQFSLKQEKIPVVHVTQLVGLAIGLSPDDVALDKNLISTRDLVDKVYGRP